MKSCSTEVTSLAASIERIVSTLEASSFRNIESSHVEQADSPVEIELKSCEVGRRVDERMNDGVVYLCERLFLELKRIDFSRDERLLGREMKLIEQMIKDSLFPDDFVFNLAAEEDEFVEK